ncbi:TPR-like protein [Coprinopsis marcescibilis]|uniref:TPR-like protein n=1 Tax=Coprinopsis marcescibilis TaxID=230819 RepID=A0A5C3KEX8_COPMA|nr:TPR-like protein [Coprinopsis marcescibilis]
MDKLTQLFKSKLKISQGDKALNKRKPLRRSSTIRGEILTGASGVVLQHSHIHNQTAQTISNVYNHSCTDTEIAEAIRRLADPKGYSWNPSRICLPGTRVVHVDYISLWATNVEEVSPFSAQIMLIPGPAGSGKSVLAHTICRDMDRNGSLVLSFFLNQMGQQFTAADFMAAFIRGLCVIDAQIKQSIAQLLIQNPILATAPAPRQFEDLVLPILPILPTGRSFFVGIDALDEQPDESILEFLRDQVPRLPPTFRFVLTMRPDPGVMCHLETRPHVTLLSSSFKLTGDTTSADIAKYIEFRLSDAEYRDSISAKLLADFILKAEGLFLWAETVLNHIGSAYDPAEELAEIVKGTSTHWAKAGRAAKKLEELYAHILSKLEWTDSRFVKMYTVVVGGLVTLREPLSRTGMAALYKPHGIAEKDIHKICMSIRPLLQSYSTDDPSQPIRLLHLSVKEYLAQNAPEPYRLDCDEHHERLSRLALHVFKNDLTLSNVCNLGYADGIWVWDASATPPSIPSFPDGASEHLRYSCQYFEDHELSSNKHIDETHISDLRDVVLERPQILLEVTASMGSVANIVSLRKKVQTPDDLQNPARIRSTIKVYYAVARCLMVDGRFTEALPLLQGAVELQSICNPDQLETSMQLEFVLCLNHLGMCLDALGQTVDGLAPIEAEALPISRQLNDTHPLEGQSLLGSTLLAFSELLQSAKRYDDYDRATNEALDIYRRLADDDPSRFEYHLGLALSRRARNFTNYGKFHESIPFFQEAIKLLRPYAEMGAEYECSLAAAVAPYATSLSVTLKPEEAIELGQEAVRLWRRLMVKDPARFGSGLSYSLWKLAWDVNECGKPVDAIRFAEESVQVCRSLVKKDATREPDLAEALQELADFLSFSERWPEAIEAGREAIDIERRLASDNPDKFNQSLAVALRRLAENHSLWGQNNDTSVALAGEAVQILRVCVDKDPACEADLAQSLQNLSESLLEAGRPEEAVKPGQEAVKRRRLLASSDEEEEEEEHQLAEALQSLANVLNTCDRAGDAIPVVMEEIKLRRALLAKDSTGDIDLELDLAEALDNLSEYLSNEERWAEAVKTQREAVEIQRRLVLIDKEKYQEGLASVLLNLASYIDDNDHTSEAISPVEESVQIYRTMVASDTSMESGLADALHDNAQYLCNTGNSEDAMPIIMEAVDLQRRLASEDPDVLGDGLSQCLQLYAACLSDCSRCEDAAIVSSEWVKIQRQLVEKDPEEHTESLAESLCEYTKTLLLCPGKEEQALEVAQEAESVYRQLAKEDPADFSEDHASSLESLARCLNASKRHEEALSAAQKALEVQRKFEKRKANGRFSDDVSGGLHGTHGKTLIFLGREAEALVPIKKAISAHRRLVKEDPDEYEEELQEYISLLEKISKPTAS